jgi:uncharacterized membrane protein
MSDTRAPNTLFFVIFAMGVLEFFHYFPLLPETLASHFSGAGRANGWMTRAQFSITFAVATIPALAVEFFVPLGIAGTKGNRLNLPNKDYWLAPERRTATFAYLQRFFAWYGCAVLLLEVVTRDLAIRANFKNPPEIPTGSIHFAISAFVIFNIAAIVAVFRRFSKPR